MKTQACRVFYFILITVVAFSTAGIGNPLRADSNPQRLEQGHIPGFVARITMPNGTSRTAEVQGVGCTSAICSRVFISGKEDGPVPVRIWLDGIAAINTIDKNTAQVVMKDGKERRLTLIPDFRVLYISGANGHSERLDLQTVKSLEILSPAR
jgi:hypothetical protein